MSILEILSTHSVAAFAGSDTACACDRTWRSNAVYRAHVAQVLERAVREREATAWDKGYDAGEGDGHTGFIQNNINPYEENQR